MPEKASRIVDNARFIRLPSAQRAALPPGKPLKGLQTRSVENVRAGQQHLTKDNEENVQKKSKSFFCNIQLRVSQALRKAYLHSEHICCVFVRFNPW